MPIGALDRDPVLHECAITKIFPRLGQVATTDAIVAHVRA